MSKVWGRVVAWLRASVGQVAVGLGGEVWVWASDMSAALLAGLATGFGVVALSGLVGLGWRWSPRGRFQALDGLLGQAAAGLAGAGSLRLSSVSELGDAALTYARARRRLERLGVFLPQVDWRNRRSLSDALNYVTTTAGYAAAANLRAARAVTAGLAS